MGYSSFSASMEKTDLALSPCLVIPYGEDQTSQAFYNICEPNNTSCRKSIPELKGKSFYQKNCHQGWLIVLCDDEEFDYTPWNYGDCFLFNPLSMETIILPCLLDWYSSDNFSLSDCVLTSPPKTRTYDGDESSMVFMLFSTAYDDTYDVDDTDDDTSDDTVKGILKFCHPGDEEWKTYVIDEDTCEVLSMCCFKGKLYLMCRGHEHLEIDIQHVSESETPSIRIVQINYGTRFETVEAFIGRENTIYYVESSDGSGIFMIEKYFITRGVYEYPLTNLLISKLDFSSMSWVQVTSLNDHVFFVSQETRLCCSAKELGFTRGFVYFTQPSEMSFYKYDLEDNSIMLSLPFPDLPNPWLSPNWIIIPTTLPYVEKLNIREKRGVTEHILGDESQVLKSTVSRISVTNDNEKADIEEARPYIRLLDDDMVWLISDNLNPLDYVHFRMVCKAYRSTFPLLNQRRSCSAKCLQATNLSPWMVFSKYNESVYSFINPMHNNENYLMSIPELLKGSVIRFSKAGWLLMSKGFLCDSVFFYNPFTKAVIKLPDLPDGVFGYRGIAFSSLPTSSDCVVFAIREYVSDKVEISFIKRGDEAWTKNQFANVYLPPNRINMEFEPSFNSPIFNNGAFNCLDVNGTLGVFTLENDIKWKVMSIVPPPNCGLIHKNYLVELEGKLLSVLLGLYGKWVRIFRLNMSEMVWIEVEQIGRHMLFISNTSCIATIAPTSQMENKIYFPRLQNKGILFYSLDSGKYHSLGSEHSSTDYCNSKDNLWCSWIEPNWSETTSPSFDWSSI